MKKIILFLIISLLGQNLHAQGVMPVPKPDPDPATDPNNSVTPPAECKRDDNFRILNGSMLKIATMDFSSLLCDEDSLKLLYEDTSLSAVNYIHSRSRCDKVAVCGGEVSADDAKQAEEFLGDNLSNAVLLGALTKEAEENRDYNIALMKYEQKNKVKVCAEESPDFECDFKLRKSLSTVVKSLVDYPEFTRAPTTDDKLASFLSNIFFKNSQGTSKKRTLSELKKNCSKKFSLKRACSAAKTRLERVKSCEQQGDGQNCYGDEQSAWASLTNDMKKNKRSLFLAVEKQLCLPSRVSRTMSQIPSVLPQVQTSSTDSILFLPDNLNLGELSVSSIMKLPTPQLPGKDAPTKEAPAKDGSPDASGAKKQESVSLGDGLEKTAQDTKPEVIHGFASRDSETLSESFYNSMNDAAGSTKNMNNSITNPTVSNWNSDFVNRARDLAQEQQAIAEEQKRKQDESNSDAISTADKKKKEEIDALTAQISGLKGKLEEMNAKVDDLKTKKAENGSPESKEDQVRAAEILDLKKKIAELEADKKKKEAEARTRAEEEAKLAATRAREEKDRSNYSSPVSFGGFSNRATQNTSEQNAEVSNAREHEKLANSISNSSSSSFEGGRSPASSGATGGGQGTVASQLVLKVVGTQASPDSNIVYMTQTELQRYPYRLSDNASANEIEKMLEGNKGSTIILGDSEQVVPILENGVVAVDENGKIKYKRIKISLVKNDKEKNQKIAREISSVADLKREEQKKRDLIRYQEMKKSIRLKTEE